MTHFDRALRCHPFFILSSRSNLRLFFVYIAVVSLRLLNMFHVSVFVDFVEDVSKR